MRGVVKCDDAAGQIETLLRHEGLINTFSVGQKYTKGVVVGPRIGGGRERCRVGIGRIRGRIEANVRDRINLEDGVARVIHGNRGIRQYGVTNRRHGLLAKDFWCVF